MNEYSDQYERRRSDGHVTYSSTGGVIRPSPPKASNIRPPSKPKNSIIQQQRQGHRQLVAAVASLRTVLDGDHNHHHQQQQPDQTRFGGAGETYQKPRFINNGVESFDEGEGTRFLATHLGHSSYTDNKFSGTRIPSKPSLAKTARPGLNRPVATTVSAAVTGGTGKAPTAAAVVVKRSEMVPAMPRRQPHMTSAAAVHKTGTWGQHAAEGYKGYYWGQQQEEEQEGEEDEDEEELTMGQGRQAGWPDDTSFRTHADMGVHHRPTVAEIGQTGRPEATARHHHTAAAPPPVVSRQEAQPRRKSLEERDLRNEAPETILGAGTKLKGGDLVVRGVLRVDGYLEAERVSANGLHVTAKGFLRADVRGMEVVFVEGTVVGDIAAQRIHLCQQGTVHGNLTCRSLQVDSGCMIVGQAHVGDMKLEQRVEHRGGEEE